MKTLTLLSWTPLYQVSDSLLTSAEAVTGAEQEKTWSGSSKSHVPHSEPLSCEDDAPELRLCKLQITITPPLLSARMMHEILVTARAEG